MLLKAVVQSIPTYAMQCFEFPKSLCDELESLCRSFWWGKKENKRNLAWISWNKLCWPKRCDGAGFRKFHNFNMAFLAKQAWRLVTIPQSLVARVLKARYFPRTTFWEAKTGYQPSFSWRSIQKVCELLKEGTRWNIGNGATVSIWKDKWLPVSNGNRVITPPRVLDPNSMVMELIDHQEHRWSPDLIRQIFDYSQAEEILNIPLGDTNQRDYLVWQVSKDGSFTVKSAYHLAQMMEKMQLYKHVPGSSKQYDGRWKKIWY